MNLDLHMLSGKTLLITGGTGMIGKCMIDYLLDHVDCHIIVTGRSETKFKERFPNRRLTFIVWDIAHDPMPEIEGPIDYIIHLASNTHPVAYATDPVSTIVMNVNATKDLLDFSVKKQIKRFVYASSVEIYGQNRGDVETFSEDYCGYIDCNTLRAGYSESKRCGEALCQAYVKQYNLDVVIPRIARVYGPTMLSSDSKALSQFIKKGIQGENIVLKSSGEQYFSYLYVKDVVDGLLTLLLFGKSGEAYNLADGRSDIRLKDLAKMIGDFCGVDVIFEVPDATEKLGFSPVVTARMQADKMLQLGWQAKYDLALGLKETISELKMNQSHIIE